MLTVVPTKSLLLIVDFQSRLMLSIDQGTAAVKNAKRRVARVAAGAVAGPDRAHGLLALACRVASSIILYLNYLILKQFV